MRILFRRLRDTSNPFELPDVTFKKLFRLSKPVVTYILREIEPHFNNRIRNTRVPYVIQLLCTLNFYGNGSYQQIIGANNLFGLSQPSVSRCITNTTEVLNNILAAQWIKFPTTQAEKMRKKQR